VAVFPIAIDFDAPGEYAMFRRLIPPLVLIVVAGPTTAQVSTWTNAVSGTFNVATNWTGGVPGTGSAAVFSAAPAAYTVTFTNSPTNTALAVQNGTVTFALGGNTYALTTVSAINIGNVSGQVGQLIITNGTLQGTAAGIGLNNGTGFLTVNTGATWTNSGNIAVGSTGAGNLAILTGGAISDTFCSIGTNSGVLGIVTVAGGTWSNSSTLVVGQQGQGTLTISNGGAVTSTGNPFSAVASDVGSTGTATVTGTGSSWSVSGVLAIGGGFSAGGNGTLTINGGGTASATGALRIWPTGTVTVDNGTLNLASLDARGGTLNFNSGAVNFTASTTFDATTLTTLLGPGQNLGGGRTLTVNGTATFAAPLTLAGGTLSVGNLAGGTLPTLTTGTLTVSQFTLNVTGNGQLGNSLTIGNALTVNAPIGVAVAADGLVRLTGGQLATGINILSNTGEIELTSDASRITGANLVNSGTIRGTGRIDENLLNNAAGQVQVTAGQRLVLNATSVTNNGILSVVGGEMQVNGVTTNGQSTGLITAHDATLRFNGGLTNNGALAFTTGQTDFYGNITSTRNVSASDRSRITVSGGGTATFYGDVTVLAGQSDVQVSGVGGTLGKVVFFGSYNGGVSGGGTAFIEGDHRPGASPARVGFGGDLVYGSGATLDIELGGTVRGSQYDAVDVAGITVLDGILDVSLIDGFQPHAGDVFTVMTFAGHSGDFATYQGLDVGNGVTLVPTLTGTSLTLTAVPEPSTLALVATAALCGTLRKVRGGVYPRRLAARRG
jgi:T5SS/PEP-CTERM-associated repeat protein